MKPLTWTQLILLGLFGSIAGYILNSILLGTGSFPIIITPLLGVMAALIAAALLITGRKVRALRNGDRMALDPIIALRVILFARASALVCSVLTGGCIGIIVSGVGRIEAAAVYESILWAGCAGLGLLMWMAAGKLVEQWGQLPEDDSDSSHAHGICA